MGLREREMVRHSCTEHDHFAREVVEMLFGPLAPADSITGSTDGDAGRERLGGGS